MTVTHFDLERTARRLVVVVHEIQRDHPAVRALRWHADGETVDVIDVGALGEVGDAQEITVIASIGLSHDVAARYAVEHDVLHLELSEHHEPFGSLTAALERQCDVRRVVALDHHGAPFVFGLRRIHVETEGYLDIAIGDHRWTGVTGPITAELHTNRPESTWVSISDGPAMRFAGSPGLDNPIVIDADHFTFHVDDLPRRTAPPGRFALGFPDRHRVIRFGP